jgi:putative ABC transport system permease protein
MSSVKMALEAIRDKKGRSFLTMLGVIIGVGAVLILITVVNGMNADIQAYYEKIGVNKVSVDITYNNRTGSADISSDLMLYVNDELGEMTAGITPDTSMTGTLRYFGGSNTTATIYLGNEQWSACNNYTLNKGRDLTVQDMDNRSLVCVIGSYVAESLFGYIDPLGESIAINGTEYTVVGIYYGKDGTAESSLDDVVVIPYTRNRAISHSSTVTSFTVKVNTSDEVETVISYLEYWLEEETDSATEYTLTNLNAQMTEAEGETTSLSLILAGVASIALIVGGIGIMNIMLVTVTERTREIGIKKAVGAKRSVIISQFLVEASVLSGIGGLLGIAVGYGGSLIIGKAMYDLILLPNIGYTISAFLFSIIIGVGFGLYPAVKASGLQPVDALRAD